MDASVAFGPKIIFAGSPGAKYIIAKTRKDTPSSTGINPTILLKYISPLKSLLVKIKQPYTKKFSNKEAV